MHIMTADNIEIYFEVVGQGIPLVMLHGFMNTLAENDKWAPLLPGYQLILPDARGHGRSGKPRDPSAYTLAKRTSDVIALLDHLGIQKAHCMGYSMGGWVSLGLAATYPERFYAMIAGGIGPDALNPESSRMWREPMVTAMKGGMENYCREVEAAEKRTMSAEERAFYLAQDHKALVAMLSLEEEIDFRHTLANSSADLLMYVGELDMHHDSAKELCARLPHAHFLSIPGRDHGSAAEPPDFLVTEILRFLTATMQE